MSRVRRIASRDNSHFKQLKALAEDPREIRRTGRSIADGIHLVETCLAREAPVDELIVSESARENGEIESLIAQSDADIIELPDALFRAISAVSSPTGIAALIPVPTPALSAFDGDVLVLDAVQDAGNIGAILRTAAAAGVKNVVLGQGCAGAWAPRVLRGGQGAHFSLSIHEQVDLPVWLPTTGIPSLATVARDGVSLYDYDLMAPCCWVFGNEGAGVSPELMALARTRITIPMAAATESLNVAAAAAVCLFEMRRQRRLVGAGLSAQI